MPLYEYHCQDCGQEFERIVRFSEADNSHECPHCQSNETVRKVSTIASTGFGSAFGATSGCSSTGRFT